MASVTIQKHTTQSACAGQCGHLYRENKSYSNREIDTRLSDKNMYVGSADSARRAIKAAIQDIDSRMPPKRIRADRKTVAELCYPAPREGMSAEETKKFTTALLDELRKVKDMRVVGAAMHLDEVHKYFDPDDKQYHMSRGHLHVLVVPDTKEKGCNMKSWLTKDRYRELNSIADRVCEHELGYAYQSGKGARSRGNVERMKEQSAIAARERAERERDMAQEEARTAKEQTAQEQARTQAVIGRRRASIEQANRQKLEALRERDAARADRDVAKALGALRNAVSSPSIPVVDIKGEIPAKKPLFGAETPERVIIDRADLEKMQRAADNANRATQTAREMDKLYKGMKIAAREANKNRIDKQAAVDRAVLSEVGQRAVRLEIELQKTKQQLQQAQVQIADLSEKLTDAQEQARTTQEVLAFFPDEWRRMQSRTHKARQMEAAYDLRKSNDWGACYVPYQGQDIPIRQFIKSYLDECNKQSITHDGNIEQHLNNLLSRDRDREEIEWSR